MKGVFLLFEVGGYFPPVAHRERIERYRENYKLFKGEHYDVFERVKKRLSPDQREVIYISVNLAGLIAKKSADFLFGESPVYSAGIEDDSNEQKAIERLVETNHLNILNYESALGNAYRGDSFYKIRWGQEYGGALPKELDEFRIFIEPQQAQYVFPETDALNNNVIKAYHIAYPVPYENGEALTTVEALSNTTTENWVLFLESHYAGRIVYRQFDIIPSRHNVDGYPSDFYISRERLEAFQVVETGIGIPLVVHVPNYGVDEGWQGLDDLSEIKPLIDELNNRISMLALILDKHSDPAMVVPAGTLEEGDDGTPIFRAARDKVFEMMDKNEVEPKYITWDGQLQAAFEEIKFLVDTILTIAEIPSVALGKDNSGTSGSSGLAIKFRMNSLLAKINRKRQYYDKAIKRVLYVAQLLEETKVDIDYTPICPKVKFKDGLPNDEYEQAQIYSLRLGGKPTISQKSAIMALEGYTEKQAVIELERIKGEEKEESTVDASIFNMQDDEDQEESEV